MKTTKNAIIGNKSKNNFIGILLVPLDSGAAQYRIPFLPWPDDSKFILHTHKVG